FTPLICIWRGLVLPYIPDRFLKRLHKPVITVFVERSDRLNSREFHRVLPGHLHWINFKVDRDASLEVFRRGRPFVSMLAPNPDDGQLTVTGARGVARKWERFQLLPRPWPPLLVSDELLDHTDDEDGGMEVFLGLHRGRDAEVHH